MTELIAAYWAPGAFPSGSSTPIDDFATLSFLAQLRDAGQAELVIENDAAVQPAVDGVVTFDLDGTRAFAAICTSVEKIAVSQNEETEELTTWSMPGHLAVYKRGVIGPPGGVGRHPIIDSFAYNYTHPAYDISGWSSATEVCSVEFAQLNASGDPANGDGRWGFLQAWDINFPPNAPSGVGSGQTKILWAADGTTDGLTTGVGKCVFAEDFTTSFAGLHILFFGADNVVKVFIDGGEQSSAGSGGNPLTSAFESVTIVQLILTAGTHRIAFEVDNYPPFGAPNPGGVAGSIYIPGYPPTLVWQSTASMKITEYVSDLPGMTPGQVLRLITEEQAARSWASPITLDCSDTLDSAGNAWAATPNIAVTVGQDTCLDVIAKIQAAYADVVLDPTGWVLHAYNWGDFAPVSGVTLTTGSNVTQLSYKREVPTAEELLVRSDALGWSTVGSGDTQGFVSLGVEVTATEVARLAGKIIAVDGDVRTEIACSFAPDPAASPSEVPWVNPDFVPGSNLTAPDIDGTPTTERVMELGATLDGNDEAVQIAITLKDRIQDVNERIIAELKV
jgi:hypothetical protein